MVRGSRMRYARRKNTPFSPSLFFFVAAALVFVIWMFAAANPFQPANPFLREVTIGQTVIGDWRYGGADASGQLRFYDTYQSILLSADTKIFAADGEFVTLDGHTPTTLTFEPVVESEALGPLTLIFVLLLAVPMVISLVRKYRRRSRGPFHH